MEELSSINDLMERNKSVSLDEYIRFHRKFISDPSKAYNYEFRITQKDKTRNIIRGVHLRGIKQFNLVKDSEILIPAIGIHPWKIKKVNDKDELYFKFNHIIEEHSALKILGEVGLDYYFIKDPDRQAQSREKE